jgi:hypothetical protein
MLKRGFFFAADAFFCCWGVLAARPTGVLAVLCVADLVL